MSRKCSLCYFVGFDAQEEACLSGSLFRLFSAIAHFSLKESHFSAHTSEMGVHIWLVEIENEIVIEIVIEIGIVIESEIEIENLLRMHEIEIEIEKARGWSGGSSSAQECAG